MTGTARKRAWRLANPEKSREAERLRAQARRQGFWGAQVLGVAPTVCRSSDSYWRYEAVNGFIARIKGRAQSAVVAGRHKLAMLEAELAKPMPEFTTADIAEYIAAGRTRKERARREAEFAGLAV